MPTSNKIVPPVGLKPKTRVPNYPELCKLFGVKPTSGNGKVKQLEELRRYAKIRKDRKGGRGFTIDEVYASPKVSTKLKTDRSYIAKYLKPQICAALLSSKDSNGAWITHQRCTWDNLLTDTGLLAFIPKFRDGSFSRVLIDSDTASFLEDSLSELFYTIIYTSAIDSIKSCLDSMQRDDGLIEWTETPYSRSTVDFEDIYPSTSEELEWQEEATEGACKEYGITSLGDMFRNNWSPKRKSEVYNRIRVTLEDMHDIQIIKMVEITLTDSASIEANLPKSDNLNKLRKAFFAKHKNDNKDYADKSTAWGEAVPDRITYQNDLLSLLYVYVLGKPIPQKLKAKNHATILECPTDTV